jgi:hypothetical protein
MIVSSPGGDMPPR